MSFICDTKGDFFSRATNQHGLEEKRQHLPVLHIVGVLRTVSGPNPKSAPTKLPTPDSGSANGSPEEEAFLVLSKAVYMLTQSPAVWHPVAIARSIS